MATELETKGAVILTLPDGTKKEFTSGQEAATWMKENNYSEYTFKKGQEPTVEEQKKSSTVSPFQSVFGSGNPIWGSDRVAGVRRAWRNNPQYMQMWTDTGNEIGAVASIPLLAGLYSASPLVAGAMNLTGAYEGLSRLGSDEGIAKTARKFREHDYKGGFKSLGGDILDVTMSFPFLNRVRQAAQFGTRATVGQGINYAINKYSPKYTSSYDWKSRTFNLTPRVETTQSSISNIPSTKLFTTSQRSALNPAAEIGILPTSKVRGYLNVPTSRRIQYGSVITLPSEFGTISLDSPEANLSFIQKFNKFNRHYGYPSITKKEAEVLAQDGNALNKVVQDRVNQHNTFYRGVFIDTKSNPEKYRELQNQMRMQGIEPTDDNALAFLATHYLPETGRGGRAGFGNIPYVQQNRYNTEDVGTIYTSNSLEQAVGYANRNGAKTYRGVFKVRRPISFEGSREDWLLNGDFPLFDTGHKYDKSNVYYQYELPYLMATGKAVPKTAIVDWNKVNRELSLENRTSDWDRQAYSNILDIYKSQNRTPHIKSFGTGTPFLDYRVRGLHDLLNTIYSREGLSALENEYSQGFADGSRMFFDFSDRPILSPSEYQVKRHQAMYPSKVLDKFEAIVNSKNYRSSQYKKFKEKMDKLKSQLRKDATTYTSSKDIIDFVTKAGITPNKPILNIGTSERLRTSTVNSNPSKAFQHVIFAGQPWEQGLEIVERVPYSEWKDIKGTTAHRGEWTPGVSRKSKKNGGKLTKDV